MNGPVTIEHLCAAAILIPLLGALAAFAAPRYARLVSLAAVALLAADVVMLVLAVRPIQAPVRFGLGGWPAPLGIGLEIDGLAAFMLMTTASVGAAAMLYGSRYFADHGQAALFMPLALLLLAGMNALFLSADIFNLYVTLELVGLSAVGLVALAGGAEALRGAMRYLLVTFLASLMYLLGVALLYHQTGMLDIRGLGAAAENEPAALLAFAVMSGAMLLKSAVFPMHFWLPPAHASAPAPVSALLSALVVKASLYVLLRLWLDAMPADKGWLGQTVGLLGSFAILWGSIQALRQQQLKLLVAYSTVAQIGYLFVPFALDSPAAVTAWHGAVYLVLSHALAKTAMFLSVGNLQAFGGDRIDELDHVVQRLPLTMGAFALAGVTIAGLPPSGGFIAKWLMLEALIAERRWWLASVVVAGGLLAAIYVFRVVGPAFTKGRLARPPRRVPGVMEWVAFTLALVTIVLGFTAAPLLRLVDAGAPFGALAEGMR